MIDKLCKGNVQLFEKACELKNKEKIEFGCRRFKEKEIRRL